MNYNLISESHTHRIYALSDTEICKVKSENPLIAINVATGKEAKNFLPQFDIDKEIECLEYANAINDLMVRFIRKDKFDEQTDMIVMERLYAIEYKSISKTERIAAYKKFEKQLLELHINGFIHGDIEHPINGDPLFLFNNIILTNKGLRLIDTGFSIIKSKERNKIKYEKLRRQELVELSDFQNYFTSNL